MNGLSVTNVAGGNNGDAAATCPRCRRHPRRDAAAALLPVPSLALSRFTANCVRRRPVRPPWRHRHADSIRVGNRYWRSNYRVLGSAINDFAHHTECEMRNRRIPMVWLLVCGFEVVIVSRKSARSRLLLGLSSARVWGIFPLFHCRFIDHKLSFTSKPSNCIPFKLTGDLSLQLLLHIQRCIYVLPTLATQRCSSFRTL